MKATPTKRTAIVGIFIFLGIVYLLSGILAVGNLHSTFVRKIRLTAVFDDVNGLQPGNNIWFSGVKIGTVDKLHFFGDSQVRVGLKIEEKAQQYIRKDAKVKISTDGLIGNKIVVIYDGTPAAGAVEDGDTLAIENLASTEEMMATLQKNNQNLLAITTDFKTISKKLVDGEGSIGKLLNDNDLYTSLDHTMASLQRSAANAEKLTAAIADYGQKLNQEGTLANDLVTDTTVFAEVRSSVGRLKALSASAAEAGENLKNASVNVQNATTKLENKESPLGVLLYDEGAGNNIRQTLKNLEGGSKKLDEDLRALQDNFFFRRYFKKKKKAEKDLTNTETQ